MFSRSQLVTNFTRLILINSKCKKLTLEPTRCANTKPYNPGPVKEWAKGIRNFDYRKKRGRKFAKVELPNFEEIKNEHKLSIDEIRSKLKEKGVVPNRNWFERPLLLTSTSQIMDSYVPPEGDGKASILSKEGAKQSMDKLTKKGKSFNSLRKIRSYLPDFDVPAFAEEALKIYIEAHEALAKMDEDKLHDLVTEYCYPDITHNVDCKTIKWQFVKSLEPPKVVHIRHQDLISAVNLFGQVTVRLHTQQILSVYDRFGRLIHGSEVIIKDVLEYVVFENHLANQYGKWRIHSKIIPDWMPKRDPVLRTFIKPYVPENAENPLILNDKKSLKKSEETDISETNSKSSDGLQPALA